MNRSAVNLAILSAALMVIAELIHAAVLVAQPDPKAVFSGLLVPVSTQDSISAYLLDSPRIGYALVDGTLIINPVFAEAGFFDSEGYALVRYRSKWGYIAPDGNFLINPVFLSATEFDCNGRALVTLENGEEILIDRTGSRADPVPSPCPSPKTPHPVPDGHLYGYHSARGKPILPPRYCQATPFHPNGLALVDLCDGKLFYINKKGQVVLERNLGPNPPGCGGESSLADWRPLLQPVSDP